MAADAANRGEGQVGVAAVGATPSHPSFKGPVKVPATCPGPAGLWPCALEFGHGGDHARVIAPDLLSLVKRFADCHEAHATGGICHEDHEALVLDSDAAIAKAEGR